MIDAGKIAIGGHSLGGFTAFGVSGTMPDRLDPRIKAALIYSSGASGYLYTEQELANVHIPVMYFSGEREKADIRGNTTMSELARKIYTSLNPPKYFLEVKNGTHFSFNDQLMKTLGSWYLSGTDDAHKVILRYSIPFLEKYAAGKDGQDAILTQTDPGLSDCQSAP